MSKIINELNYMKFLLGYKRGVVISEQKLNQLDENRIKNYINSKLVVEQVTTTQTQVKKTVTQCPPGQYWDGKSCVDTITKINFTPYRDKTGKPLKVIPTSGKVYVTDPNDPKILEYKRRMELYNISKDEVYPKLEYQWNWDIINTQEEIKKNEEFLKQNQSQLNTNEINSYNSVINSDKKYIENRYRLLSLNYDNFLVSGDNLLEKPKDVNLSIAYNTARKGTNYNQPTFNQQKLIDLGVKKYKIYPDYEYNLGETSNRPLFYKKPTLEFIYADPEIFIWNQPRVIKWACPSARGGSCVEDNNGKFNSKEECENTTQADGGCKVEPLTQMATLKPKEVLNKNKDEIVKNVNVTSEAKSLEVGCNLNENFSGVKADSSKNYVGLEYNATIVAGVGNNLTINFDPFTIPDAFYVKYGKEEFFSGFRGKKRNKEKNYQKTLNSFDDLKDKIQQVITRVGGTIQVNNRNLVIKDTESWSTTINVVGDTNLKILVFSPLGGTKFKITTTCSNNEITKK